MLSGAVATKTKSIGAYFGISIPAVAFLGIDTDILIVWVTLMIIDTIMGNLIAFFMKEFASRTSQDRLARKIVLVVAIMTISLIGTIYEPVQYLSQVALLTFTLAEAVSVIRHCYTIYAKEKLPESEVIKNVFGAIISVLSRAQKK